MTSEPRIRGINDDSLALAAELVHAGELIVMPTDTVYGVACDPRNPDAIARIFAIKRRPRFKSLQVLLHSIDQLDELGLELPAPLNRLAAQFLPGAFSPIALAREDCDLCTLSRASLGACTQGVRIPNSAAALAILRATGPLAASSANLSGQDSAQSVNEAAAALGDQVALYLDGGPTQGHVASTVVAADPHGRDGIEILREGVIASHVIRKALHMNGGGLGA
ncbi:L-threonylcarbamoyladenylate synthase [Bifidobacterium eulemuris]|uniref:L-threonylcarbamoyladenylate synthase n=1 Tax=Bifidobacterium eulemuris TaxID=1765219 RepID=A0A261GCG0_9BIFI|nr:L-threonylcarbamoyladenylate synthase [Bifidobacterium eulemuris]OZG68656.1 translation factor Sua5 [Bifidobacterium eulemuris]QOL32771.1 threonylcarbamoyl-AMP synthase [Bifidobacterium eulemuris]